MEHLQILDINSNDSVGTSEEFNEISSGQSFIGANTIRCSFDEIKRQHIIPVFIRDNEPAISQAEFIETTVDVVQEIFKGEAILKPNIRVSHPIKGRVPEARNKPANELLETEKTLYYERAAFVIEIPSISDVIEGQTLSLSIGGVKAHCMDNYNGKKGLDEHFKFFIGFKVSVCTNLCVHSDGFYGDIRVKTLIELRNTIYNHILTYNAPESLLKFKEFNCYQITEQQFANMIGRCRMFKYLPQELRQQVPELLLGESQINTIIKDYYQDQNFCRMEDGNINLWRLYNLLTNANKSSYIDQFLERNVNAYSFVQEIKNSLAHSSNNWYLN